MRLKCIVVLLVGLAGPILHLWAQPPRPTKSEPSPPAQLAEIGATYNLAQVAGWVSPDRFLVGRWDGTLSLFRPPVPKKESQPVLTQVWASPSRQGVQMQARINARTFVTSNDDSSLAIWGLEESQAAFKEVVQYDPKFGVANSAELVLARGKRWLITGHSQGYLVVWEVDGDTLRLDRGHEIRSPSPIPSPFPMGNVRAIVRSKGEFVVTGGEDGDLCLIAVPDGKVVYRTRYNPTAQRGINHLSVAGDLLLLANCSVGTEDKNLWLYQVKDGAITLRDSANLIQDKKRAQVFNFSVVLVPFGSQTLFFASTEEGLLWRGTVAGGRIQVGENKKIECEAGAALAYEPESGRLGVAAHAIRLYQLSGQ